MMSNDSARPFFLGIEGGGTHTVALLADSAGKLIKRFETGPANLKLLSDSQLSQLLETIAQNFPAPDAIAIGLAGARAESDWRRIRTAAAAIWPKIPCHATHDLATALAAPEDKKSSAARVLVLSGTGSCCYGQNASGQVAKVGGWGHLLGDKGSGYEIALRALKAVIFYYDRDGEWPKLGAQFLTRLLLNEPNDLVAWIQGAEKSQVASLAPEVFDAWHRRDVIATDILDAATRFLADDAVACALKLAKAGTSVQFILAGSVLLKQPRFADAVGRRIKKNWPNAVVTPLARESAWGAVNLARANWDGKTGKLATAKSLPVKKSAVPEMPLADLVKSSPTEQRNPRSMKLDKLSIAKSIELFLADDAKIPASILKERKGIEQAVKFISHAFQNGGRLFYIGAGTSGRLGVLDASECPPTFRTPPELVQGIIAGGQGALWRSVEGAEDDPSAGARAIEFRQITRRDVVVGIAASGRTPYVWGALGEARKRGAKTVLLAFNPYITIPRAQRPDVVITPNVGPEILTGSTRLKSGTATKLVLNIFTTLAMVRIGKIASNLMIDLNPSNIKLQDRAARIVQQLENVDYDSARTSLEKSGWVIKQACARLQKEKQSRKRK